MGFEQVQKIGEAANIGEVVAVRGSVIDVCFPSRIPMIHNRLMAPDAAGILVEVLAHLDHETVRGIALTPTQGLSRGSLLVDTGGSFTAPIGPALLGRMFNVFGETIDGKGKLDHSEVRPVHRRPPALTELVTSSEILETGIKVIDVLAPLERGGKTGLFGGAGVGKTVLITEELLDIVAGFEAMTTKEGSHSSMTKSKKPK